MKRRTSIPNRSDIFVRTPEPQTLRAWEPFGWCINSLFELQNTEIDDEHPEWIRTWVFGVTMLRTTGHVLAKVDGPKSDRHRLAIDERWRDWRSRADHHWIFNEFIEKERNSILKAFKLGVNLDSDGIWHEELQADGLTLLREAVYWWRGELEGIESAIRE